MWQENENSKDSNMITSVLSDCLKVRLQDKICQSRWLRLYHNSCFGQKKNMNMVVHAHRTSTVISQSWHEHTFPVKGQLSPIMQVFGRIEDEENQYNSATTRIPYPPAAIQQCLHLQHRVIIGRPQKRLRETLK